MGEQYPYEKAAKNQSCQPQSSSSIGQSFKEDMTINS